jgi:hypothetical protein
MTRLQSLESRRIGGYIGGVLLLILGAYLRLFVFVKLGPGALLVYGTGGAGALLLEVGRKASREIKAQRFPS